MLTPVSRQSAGTASPASARFNTAMIWLSVNLDFLMQNFLLNEKILPLDPTVLRGDYRWSAGEANKSGSLNYKEQRGILVQALVVG